MPQLIERQEKVVEKLQQQVLDNPTDVNAVNSLASAVLDLIRLKENAN